MPTWRNWIAQRISTPLGVGSNPAVGAKFRVTMNDFIDMINKKLRKTWLKLLKAEAKHKRKKVQKLEKKLMDLEWKMQRYRSLG